MRNKKKENQKPANQGVKGNTPSPNPHDDALAGMPPEERDTKKVTRQSRYVTYYVEENKNQKQPTPQERANEEVKSKVLPDQGIDVGETLVQGENTGVKVDNTGINPEEQPSVVKTVKVTPEKYNAEDKALQSFADVLINHLEKIDVGDWTRPWIVGENLTWPRNIDGREYAASNAIILLMHTQQRGYTAPIYATFDRIRKLNFADDTKDERLKDAEGNPLPWVMVKEGEKHMPVTMTVYSAVHKQTKERIPFSEYAQLSQEQQKEYNVYPRSFVYRVFNIDQTNLKEARPQLYEQLTHGEGRKFQGIKRDEDMSFPAVDAMIDKKLWQCPIEPRYGGQAYYSKVEDTIIIPEKRQFKYPESYYGTLFHECAHSTGAPQRYNRQMGEAGTKQYAREELVAELTAALVASRYGLTKHVKSDSLPYLKSWLNTLKEKPDFIKELLSDVRKASSQIIRRVDLIQNRVEELRNMGVPCPEQYPDFLDLDTENQQPIGDPLRYPKKDDENKAQQQVNVGRGRR